MGDRLSDEVGACGGGGDERPLGRGVAEKVEFEDPAADITGARGIAKLPPAAGSDRELPG